MISEILSGVERVRIDTDRNLQDVLDQVDEIRQDAIDDTHGFALSQVYEGLLADLGEKSGDGGQFFAPREIIRAVARIVDPKVGKKWMTYPVVLHQRSADEENLVLHLSDLKVGKRTPFTLDPFEDLFKLLPKRGDCERI